MKEVNRVWLLSPHPDGPKATPTGGRDDKGRRGTKGRLGMDPCSRATCENVLPAWAGVLWSMHVRFPLGWVFTVNVCLNWRLIRATQPLETNSIPATLHRGS